MWDVVARWHGLAPLHELYFHPSKNLAYRKSIFPDRSVQARLSISRFFERGEPLLEEQILDLQEEASSRPFPESPAPACDASMKGRFYRALTGYWLAIEVTRNARPCLIPLRTCDLDIYTTVDALWDDGRSVHESLDMLEMNDFVYGYLIRQAEPAALDAFIRWAEHQGWPYPTGRLIESEWPRFVQNIRLTLSPAEVIELLLLTSHWKYTASYQPDWSSNEKARDLRLWTFFEFLSRTTYRSVMLHFHVIHDTLMRIWLESGPRAATESFGDQERSPQLMWEDYRRTKLETEVRGTHSFGGSQT